MVDFFKKRKKADETQVLANGKIVITPFSKMDKTDFPQEDAVEMFFLSPDGRIVFNSEEPANEALIQVYKILVNYSRADLEKWERRTKKRFPNIRTAEDLTKLESKEDEFVALVMLCIPGELNRRKIEKSYY